MTLRKLSADPEHHSDVCMRGEGRGGGATGHTQTLSLNWNVFDGWSIEGLNIMLCQNIFCIDGGSLTDRTSMNVTLKVSHTAKYRGGDGDLNASMSMCSYWIIPCHKESLCPWRTVSYVSWISYLCYLQHLGVEPVQMQHELSQANECQLDCKHLPESPVISGIGERVESPLLQHASRHHVPLNFFQDVP